MTTCRKLACNKEATHVIEVNALVRGYAEDPAPREQAEKTRGRIYIRDVRARGSEGT